MPFTSTYAMQIWLSAPNADDAIGVPATFDIEADRGPRGYLDRDSEVSAKLSHAMLGGLRLDRAQIVQIIGEDLTRTFESNAEDEFYQSEIVEAA